jgi:hypothetical protein
MNEGWGTKELCWRYYLRVFGLRVEISGREMLAMSGFARIGTALGSASVGGFGVVRWRRREVAG